MQSTDYTEAVVSLWTVVESTYYIMLLSVAVEVKGIVDFCNGNCFLFHLFFCKQFYQTTKPSPGVVLVVSLGKAVPFG